MSAAAAPVRGLRIVSPTRGPRFLGLTAAERHARLAARFTPADSPDATLPVLEVPDGVIVTRDAIAALPPPTGVWLLQWEDAARPLVWRAPDLTGRAEPRPLPLPAGVVLDVSTRAARRRAAWALLQTSGKPTDAWLSRHVHRRISRLFSYLFLQLGISANVATFLVFGVGVCAAWLMAQTSHATMIAGGFLFWFASIADGIDGEMARLTMSESAFGEQLDTAVDHATHLLGYAGVMIGWWRQGIGAAGAATAIAAGIGIPVGLLWAMGMVRRARHITGQFFVDTKPIEYGVIDAAAQTGAPPLRAATWIWVLLRREAFSLTFFLLSLATGRRAIYPVLVVVVMAYVCLIFALYGRTIERAIAERYQPRTTAAAPLPPASPRRRTRAG